MKPIPNGAFLPVKSQRKIQIALSYLSAGEASETTDDYELLDVNELITGGKEGMVAYRVTGDSMLEYIKPGYIVFVDPYQGPKNGDIIVSRINGKNNIKIFKSNDNGLYLVSANKTYPPCKITKVDDFHILGVVKGHLAVY